MSVIRDHKLEAGQKDLTYTMGSQKLLVNELNIDRSRSRGLSRYDDEIVGQF